MIQPAVDEVPYGTGDEPEGYAPYTPVGQCETHGLEAYRPCGREVRTGYDVCIAMVFICGEIDKDSVF